jgi:hypothetical protein
MTFRINFIINVKTSFVKNLNWLVKVPLFLNEINVTNEPRCLKKS